MMIDGIRDERSAINNSYPVPDLSCIESIELLKGPASVLYGHSAVGGTLNIVRKSPSEKQSVNARLAYGSYENKEATLGMGGKLVGPVNYYAVISGAVDEALTDETMAECDVILLAVRPAAAVEWLKNHAAKIDKHTVVIDCCGTKRKVCAACFPIAEQYGITYLGGHPMAGTQFSGFKYAKANLFVGAPMVLVPPRFDDIELLSHVKDLLSPAGFGSYSVTTAEQHDEMIAFTSQLAHVASNAYIKSPTAKKHKGFSAGSYKDMTRVAWLAPHMWAELFMENKEFLLKEIDCYIEHLSEYKTAMENDDEETLIRLLDEGKKRKEEVDG